LPHARILQEGSRRDDNEARPLSRFGRLTPKAYAKALIGQMASLLP
jgi:hypothetical protein